MSGDRMRDDVSMLDNITALSEGNAGAVAVLMELVGNGTGLLYWHLCDSKRLYGGRIWALYKDICAEDFGRFRYHLEVELPNQETGSMSPSGPYAPPTGEAGEAFWNARMHAKPGVFWALANPPKPGYRYPLNLDGSEPAFQYAK